MGSSQLDRLDFLFKHRESNLFMSVVVADPYIPFWGGGSGIQKYLLCLFCVWFFVFISCLCLKRFFFKCLWIEVSPKRYVLHLFLIGK
jgi:hypothetical protein